VDELSDDDTSLVVGLYSIDEPQMPFYILPAPVADRKSNNPHYQGIERQRGNEDHPEVGEEEDLLVEEVDRKNALHVVAMNGAESADFEVAHCDSWKSGGGEGRGRPRPIRADFYEAADDVDAVRVEGYSEERVEEKQLAEDVEKVEALDEQVGHDEVVAAVAATRVADRSRQKSFDARTRCPGLLLLGVVMTTQVSVTRSITVHHNKVQQSEVNAELYSASSECATASRTYVGADLRKLVLQLDISEHCETTDTGYSVSRNMPVYFPSFCRLLIPAC